MEKTGYKGLIGTGGIGSGIFFELEGDHTLGRNESRLGVLSNARDFCKLHIICHYIAVLMRSDSADKSSFQTVTIGRVGRDETGREMVRMMQQTGMDTSLIKETDGAATLFSACFQYPDSSGGNITTARSASSLLTPEDVRQAEPVCEKYGTRGMALAAPEAPLECRLEPRESFKRCAGARELVDMKLKRIRFTPGNLDRYYLGRKSPGFHGTGRHAPTSPATRRPRLVGLGPDHHWCALAVRCVRGRAHHALALRHRSNSSLR